MIISVCICLGCLKQRKTAVDTCPQATLGMALQNMVASAPFLFLSDCILKEPHDYRMAIDMQCGLQCLKHGYFKSSNITDITAVVPYKATSFLISPMIDELLQLL